MSVPRSLANAVVSALTEAALSRVPAPDPALTQALAELRAAGDAVAAAAENPGATATALVQQQWDAAVAQVAQRAFGTTDPAAVARETVLAQLPDLPGLREAVAAANAGVYAKVSMGPLSVSLDVSPAELALGGTAALRLGPGPLAGLGAALGSGPFKGSGTLRRTTGQPPGYAGSLGLRLGVVDVVGYALVDDLPSLLVLLRAEFSPGIQLSFGFALSAIGGLIGVQRDAEVPAIRARLADGTATDALFPSSSAKDPAAVLDSLQAMFPSKPGAAVIGPTFQLTWLKVAGDVALARLDVGAFLRFPGPSTILLVGRLVVEVPPADAPLLHLQIDALGELDLAGGRLVADGSLVRSRAFGVFAVTGDSTLALAWGDRPSLVFSAGGFHPAYRPEPPLPRPLRRLGLSLDSPIPGVLLRAEAYLAVTPNSVQFGGHVEAGLQAGPFEAYGFLTVDALFRLRPSFSFDVNFEAGLRVRFDGFTLGSIGVHGRITGPGPIRITAGFSVELLFLDISHTETFTIGPARSVSDEPADLQRVLVQELERPGNLRASDAVDPAVVSAPRPVPAGATLVGPTSVLAWSQRRVPLEVPLARVDGVDLAAESQARVELTVPAEAAGPASPVTDDFAPGSYRHLTAAQALVQPAYDRLRSGLSWRLAPDTTAPARPGDASVVERYPGEPALAVLLPSLFLPFSVQAAVSGTHLAATVLDVQPVISERDMAWEVVSPSGTSLYASQTAAHWAATGGAVPCLAGDRVDLSGVL